MGNMFDDGLDEYIQQEVNPTASVSQAAPQRKSAEQAEIEKSLEVIKGIKGVQDEIRSAMSDLQDMAEKAERLTHSLSEAIRTAKPIWDDLLQSFVKEIQISEESLEAFGNVMKGYADTILKKVCEGIYRAVTDNVAGQFNEMANSCLTEFDEKLKALVATFDSLKQKYNDNIKSLEKSKDKLLEQAVEENNRIIMPRESFWVMMSISLIVIFGGLLGWIKFWRTPGNDETMSLMVAAGITEVIYCVSMFITRRSNEKEGKKEKENIKMFSVSLPEAIYIVLLTLASGVYIVWSQLTVISSASLLIYLMPGVIASNFLWLLLRALLYGIFQKK